MLPSCTWKAHAAVLIPILCLRVYLCVKDMWNFMDKSSKAETCHHSAKRLEDIWSYPCQDASEYPSSFFPQVTLCARVHTRAHTHTHTSPEKREKSYANLINKLIKCLSSHVPVIHVCLLTTFYPPLVI